VDQFDALPQKLIFYIRDEIVVTQPVYGKEFYSQRKVYDLNKGEAWTIKIAKNFRDRFKAQWKKNKVISKDTTSVVIRGYPTQRAEIKTEEGLVDVFYTDHFGINFFPHGEIEGVPLKYSIESKYFGKVNYELINLEVGPLQNEIFDYESVQEFANSADQKKNMTLIDKLKIRDMELKEEVIPNPSDDAKLYVLNFWFIGCQPCIRELPLLNNLVEKYVGDKQVRFIAVARDKASQIQRFLRKTNFHYEQMPFGVKLASRLNISVYPTNMIIDDTGKVLFYEEGYGGTVAFDMDQIIQNILGK